MEIILKDKCTKQTITRDDGSTVAQMIADAWDKEEKIIIDFSNILIASVSFLDEAFGKLAFDHPKEDLTQKLSFKNMQEYDKALLNDIFLSRYHQKELGQNGLSKSNKRKRIPLPRNRTPKAT
jgi:maltose-binding protein MalE